MTKWISYDKLVKHLEKEFEEGKIDQDLVGNVISIAKKVTEPLPYHKCYFAMQDLKVYDGLLNINNNVIYTPYVTTDFLDNMNGAEWKIIDEEKKNG